MPEHGHTRWGGVKMVAMVDTFWCNKQATLHGHFQLLLRAGWWLNHILTHIYTHSLSVSLMCVYKKRASNTAPEWEQAPVMHPTAKHYTVYCLGVGNYRNYFVALFNRWRHTQPLLAPACVRARARGRRPPTVRRALLSLHISVHQQQTRQGNGAIRTSAPRNFISYAFSVAFYLLTLWKGCNWKVLDWRVGWKVVRIWLIPKDLKVPPRSTAQSTPPAFYALVRHTVCEY